MELEQKSGGTKHSLSAKGKKVGGGTCQTPRPHQTAPMEIDFAQWNTEFPDWQAVIWNSSLFAYLYMYIEISNTSDLLNAKFNDIWGDMI